MVLLRDRLKPCPFCGGIADYKEDGYHGWVQCIECLATTDKYYAWRDKNWKGEATNDWNDRVLSTDQDKLQIEEAEHLKTIKERDRYHDAVDQLANAIADHFGADIGEHSNIIVRGVTLWSVCVRLRQKGDSMAFITACAGNDLTGRTSNDKA